MQVGQNYVSRSAETGAASTQKQVASASSGASWANALMDAMKTGGQGQASAASGAGGLSLDDIIAAGLQGRIEQPEDLTAFLDEVDSHWDTAAAQKKQEVMDTFKSLLSGDNFYLGIDDAVYEKMAADPEFESRVNALLEQAANHPWMTTDIPGLVSRSVHVNENGEVTLCVLVDSSKSGKTQDSLESYLKEMLDDAEADMHTVVIDQAAHEGKTHEEIMREMVEAYWEARKQALEEALKEAAEDTGDESAADTAAVAIPA